jgi:hypothetical protein
MKVLEFTEQENGPVTISLELTEDENRMFIEYAINRMMKDYLFELETVEKLEDEVDEVEGGE